MFAWMALSASASLDSNLLGMTVRGVCCTDVTVLIIQFPCLTTDFLAFNKTLPHSTDASLHAVSKFFAPTLQRLITTLGISIPCIEALLWQTIPDNPRGKRVLISSLTAGLRSRRCAVRPPIQLQTDHHRQVLAAQSGACPPESEGCLGLPGQSHLWHRPHHICGGCVGHHRRHPLQL